MSLPCDKTENKIQHGSESIEKMDKKRSLIPQYVATFVVTLVALTYGLGIGWTATAVPVLQSKDSPIPGGPITNQDISWLASTLCIVAAASTPIYRYFCEKFGCKITGYLTVIPFIISTLCVIFANSVIMLHISRVLFGIATGGYVIFCPIYISEIAEDNVRGALGVINVLMLNTGIFVAYVIGTYFAFHTAAWICIVPPLAFILLFFWMPETPVYLLRNDKQLEAAKSLQWLRGKNSDITKEFEQMETALEAMNSVSSSSASYSDLFSSRGTIRALIISLALFFNQQFCGIFGIINYTVIIFKESGSDLSPNTSSIIVGFMLIVATVVAWYLCDRIGRKSLLLMSDILMAISLIILGIYFYLKEQGVDIHSFGWLPVTCLSIDVMAINLGINPLPTVIITEIFSPNLRSMAVSVIQPINWMLCFIVTKFYADLCDLISIYGAYWFFSAWCILGAVFIVLVIPETKGRPLEHILEELEGSSYLKVPTNKNLKCDDTPNCNSNI